MREVNKKWKNMTDEEKRPFIEKCQVVKERWEAENALMPSILAQLKALKKSVKMSGVHNSGYALFLSEAQIPYDPDQNFSSKVAKMWKDLKQEERNAYNERAKDLFEKGQEELVESAMKKIEKRFNQTPYILFIKQSLPETLKASNKEIRIEWERLNKEEKSPYTEGYEKEMQEYHAKIGEYKEGAEFKKRKKAVSIIKAKIKKLENEMNKPKLVTNSFQLYVNEIREIPRENYFANLQKICGKNWKAMSEEEKAVYKRRWEELKSKWQEDMAKWESKNADSPKMT